MATYYRWRKSDVGPVEVLYGGSTSRISISGEGSVLQIKHNKPNIVERKGRFLFDWTSWDAQYEISPNSNGINISGKWFHLGEVGAQPSSDRLYDSSNKVASGPIEYDADYASYGETLLVPLQISSYSYLKNGPGDFVGYVYSTNVLAYPNGGEQDGFWYDQRTTVTSPTAPPNITTPNPITTPSITVSRSAATSNVPDYPVNRYELSYSVNGGSSWTVAGTTADTSLEVDIPEGTTSIQFRVRARDSNGQWGTYSASSTAIPVYLAPTLTVPQMLMQGQQATINWTSIEGADSYTLERKSSADSDWTQVYSGANTTFSETAGTWTTVQYRVQAVFDGTPGGWATSAEIPVVSASALVISGQDGDLGTLVNDVPYSIITDTGNQITVTITTNGAVIFSGNVGNSVADVIPVLDLISGEGTITIEASVTASSGPVSAVRTWTYTKTMMTFPNAGSIAELTKDGKVMWPETLANAVRLPGGRTLDQVMGFPAQVYAGSYVGTGTYGQNNPNELTFPFEPKFVTIIPASQFTMGNAYGLIWTGQPGSPDINNNAFILDGKTLKWYAESAAYQCNSPGMTFYYAALG